MRLPKYATFLVLRSFRCNKHQEDAIRQVAEMKRDVNLPTSYGNSVVFQALPTVSLCLMCCAWYGTQWTTWHLNLNEGRLGLSIGALCQWWFWHWHLWWHVGWICCWFSPLLREDFLRVLRFSPLTKKNQHFQIPIRPGIRLTKNHFVDVLPPNHYSLLFIIICSVSEKLM